METSNDSVELKEILERVAKLLRSGADVDAFPAEQSRIDRPCAWTDKREGSADRRQENACERIIGVRESEPDPDCGDERSSNGRPQPGDQKGAGRDRQQRGDHGCRWPAGHRRNGPRNEGGSTDEPHDEQTHARPAVSESREEPAHNTPARAYGLQPGARNPRKSYSSTLSSTTHRS